jgi:hypothetical protein
MTEGGSKVEAYLGVRDGRARALTADPAGLAGCEMSCCEDDTGSTIQQPPPGGGVYTQSAGPRW